MRFKIIEFSNYDGDSFDLTLDLGFELVYHQKCRIEGIDTPELRGGTTLTKAAARLARDVAREWVQEAMEDGGAVFFSETYRGKYGRPLGDIERTSDGASMRQHLLDNHLGVPYHGQAKSKVAGEHADNLKFLMDSNKIVLATKGATK